MLDASEKRFRRSIRLKDYDYSEAGAYFVTVCAQHRACLFGAAAEGLVHLNDAGHMLAATWNEIPARFHDVQLDAFVVMPNHVHGVIVLPDTDGEDSSTGSRAALGAIIGAFKSLTTVEYVRAVSTKAWSPFRGHLWQRNYYEHVIRGERDLNRIRQYIEENPARWDTDEENPERLSPTEG